MSSNRSNIESELAKTRKELNALRAEHALLKELVYSNEAGLFFIQDNRIIFCNPYFSKLTGYSENELLNLNYFEIIHPRDKKLIKLLFQNDFDEIRQKKSNSYTFRILTKDGELKWLKTNVSVIEWNGKLAQLNSCFDITQQKEAENKLIEEEQNFRVLVNAFEDLIFIFNKNGNVIQTNQAVINKLGYPEHELLLKPFKSFLNFDESDLNQLIQSAFQGKKCIFLSNLISKKKVLIPVEIRLFNGTWSNKDVIFGICQDISVRVKAERAIKLSEEKFSKAFNSSAVMMTISTFKLGTYIDVNDTFLKLTGLKKKEIIGKTSHELGIFKEIGQREQMLEYIDKHQKITDQEVTLIPKKGGKLICLFSAEVINIQNEKCLLAVLSDITQRKQIEGELIKAKELAEEASKAKEQFLSTMSHEIRTPMNAVIGMTNILLNENPKPEQLPNLTALKYSAENLLALLNDILDFSKIEAGKIEISSLPIDIKTTAENLRNSFDQLAKEKGIELKTSIDKRIPLNLLGDQVRINQVLTNLIGNALKFTEKGSVELSLKLVKDLKNSAHIAFSISDTGIGINKNFLGSIFREFTQVNAETTRRFGGTGLGLAISQRLVKLQGGSIKVRSIPEKGSTFYFTLKLSKYDPSLIKNQNVEILEEKLIFSKPYKILVVEDNEINKLIAEKFLVKWGLAVDHAENGKEAIDKISENSYDLILMDLEMPVMSGYEATTIIRSLPDATKSKVPIIALTASAMQDIQRKIYSLGMNDFVIKPFNPAELRKILFYHLENQNKN